MGITSGLRGNKQLSFSPQPNESRAPMQNVGTAHTGVVPRTNRRLPQNLGLTRPTYLRQTTLQRIAGIRDGGNILFCPSS